ncbi:MAG: hypothetical protein CMP91_10235 [Gammaproteobacteria bacterium]|nr:hypothetical protein [Gammaproteobacteria bacterium]
MKLHWVRSDTGIFPDGHTAMNKLISILLACMLVSCEEPAILAVGLLESERIEITAESTEPITEILVTEGQRVAAGEILLTQDKSRVLAREQEVRAGIARLEALLAQQVTGPRQEVIEAARAALEAAQVQVDINQLELNRLQRLGANVATQERIDLASSQLDGSRANLNQASARLRELQAGTRDEEIEQTRQELRGANARLDLILIDKQRHELKAPLAGVIDSLPFEQGERPMNGSVVAVLLTGDQPFARVYVPEALRVNIRPGAAATVYIDGLESPVAGTVRRIASESSFTPYFSLTEHDRGRLSYLAEIILDTERERLPDGVPVEVSF